MCRIDARCGMSFSTIYKYFRDKEHLSFEFINWWLAEFRLRLDGGCATNHHAAGSKCSKLDPLASAALGARSSPDLASLCGSRRYAETVLLEGVRIECEALVPSKSHGRTQANSFSHHE
jgi:hypothetical protein